MFRELDPLLKEVCVRDYPAVTTKQAIQKSETVNFYQSSKHVDKKKKSTSITSI